jgi:hypothetical protein
MLCRILLRAVCGLERRLQILVKLYTSCELVIPVPPAGIEPAT